MFDCHLQGASPERAETDRKLQLFKETGLYTLLENVQRLKPEETAVYIGTHGGVRGR